MRAVAGQPLVMAARRGCPARFAEQGRLALAVENDGETDCWLGLGDGRDTAGPFAAGAPSRYSYGLGLLVASRRTSIARTVGIGAGEVAARANKTAADLSSFGRAP